MKLVWKSVLPALWCLLSWPLGAGAEPVVLDLPTRPGVTQRILLDAPPEPRALVLLFAGGHGGLRIFPGGSMLWGDGNFLVRSRQLFVKQGLAVAVVDAPSDRRNAPFLDGFRNRPEHAEDVRQVIAALRPRWNVPVWLVGTSRGTQSVAFLGTELPGPDGPDGLVLTASILRDSRQTPVTELPLGRLTVPTLVVHHERDGCPLCAPADLPRLMDRLAHLPRTALMIFQGGSDLGHPCEAFAHHGFNGIEAEVVTSIVEWMLRR